MNININNNTKLVSIIVPCYNYGIYLMECLIAIKNQTYKNIEVIIIDDESTDNTREVAEAFLGDHRFKYVHQNNLGLAGARNTGIRNAQGNFIAIVDPDDIWFPHKIEDQIEYMESHINYGLVYSDAEIIIDGKTTGQTIRMGRLFYEGWCFRDMLMDNGVVCPSVLIRASCFKNVGLFDELELKQYSEDWDMWLKISYHYKIGSIKRPLLYYRVHDKNMSKSCYQKHIANKIITLERHIPKVNDAFFRKKCWEYNLKKMFYESIRKDVMLAFHILCYMIKSKLSKNK